MKKQVLSILGVIVVSSALTTTAFAENGSIGSAGFSDHSVLSSDCQSSLEKTIRSAKSVADQGKLTGVDSIYAIHQQIRNFVRTTPAKCSNLREVAVDFLVELPYGAGSEDLKKLQKINFEKFIQSAQQGSRTYPRAYDIYDGSHLSSELGDYLNTLNADALNAKENGDSNRLYEVQDQLRTFIRRAGNQFLTERASGILNSL